MEATAAAAAEAARRARAGALSLDVEGAARTFAQAGEQLQNPLSPAAAREQAEGWLVELQQGDAAWRVLRCVLSDGGQSDATKWLAATVLSNKLREVGDLLAPAERQQLMSDTFGYLTESTSSNPPRGPPLTVAACRAAVCGGASGVAALIEEAPSRLGGGEAMLNVLASLPDEWAARAAGQTSELQPIHGAVLKSVGAALQAMGAAGADQYPLVRTAVRVLLNWLQNGGLTIDTLHSSGMISGLAPALLVPDLFSTVAELFTTLCDTCHSANNDTALFLVTIVMAQLAQLEGPITIAARDPDAEQSSLEVANLLASLGNHALSTLAQPPLLQDTPDAASMIRIGLACAGHPSPSVRESSLEFWSRLAALLTVHPRPAITPAFAQLLQLMLESCSYPLDFPTKGTDSWQDSSEVDEDAWERHRRAAAVLIADCCGVVGPEEVLRMLCSALPEAKSWQAVEAVLFQLSCISNELAPQRQGIMRRVSSLRGASTVSPLAASALSEVFGHMLTSTSDPCAHPLCRAATFRLAAAYTGWLSSDPGALETVLHLAVEALAAPPAVSERTLAPCAANFVAQIGRDAGAQLAKLDQLLDGLLGVLPHVLNATRQSDTAHKTGVLLIEGVARAVGFSNAEKLLARLAVLVGPLTIQLRAATAGGDSAAPEAVRVLHLLRSTVQFLNASTRSVQQSAQHPVLTIIEQVWPDVSGCAAAFCANAEVSSAVSELLQMTLRSADVAVVGSLLAPVGELVIGSNEAAPLSAGWLELLVVVVEVCGRQATASPAAAESGPALLEQLSRLVRTVVGRTLAAVSTTDAGGAAQAVEGVLDVGFRCALFCPSALRDSEVANGLLELAVACLGMDQRGPLRSACMLLGRLCQDIGRGGSSSLPAVSEWFVGTEEVGGIRSAFSMFRAATQTSSGESLPKMMQVFSSSLSLVRSLGAAADTATAFGMLLDAEQERTGRRVDATQQQQIIQALWGAEPGSPGAEEAALALVKLHRGEVV